MSKLMAKFSMFLNNTRFMQTEVKIQYPKKSTNIMDKPKIKHPYRKIHPWKSKGQFITSIADSVLFNKDGLVAINKPYGISAVPRDSSRAGNYYLQSNIVDEKHYTVADALVEIADKLGYESLSIIEVPEKFTSGIVLLSANKKVKDAVALSLRRAEGARIIPRTYWTVSRRIPVFREAEHHLAMKQVPNSTTKGREVVIVDSWYENERKRNEIKILNVQHKVLSTSTKNVASLLEIKPSTVQWHAHRLFAATVLLSPVLGDRLYGSRAQLVMGKFLKVSPFVEAAHLPPVLDAELLELLKLTPAKTTMIPVHVHLREIFLPRLFKKGDDVKITAPLHPEFIWTCQQLEFKGISELNENNQQSELDHDLTKE